jgi:HAD superfamily hydrolase (TIGR01490 family)
MPSAEEALGSRRPERRHTGAVAIFDLDRTLLRGSSLVDLGRALVDRRVVGRALLARHAVGAAVFAGRGLGASAVDRVRERLLAAAAGRPWEDLHSVVRDVAPEIARRVYPGARWLLERHRDAGDFCVVLSASPQELVEAVAAELGAHRGVGTRAEVADGRLTGRLDGPFCHGAGKLERLCADVGPVDLHRASAYGDSASDLPLLAACGWPVAVNPDRELLAAARASGWPVLRLQ